VDQDALPEPEWDRNATGDEFVAPRTETERRLAEIWSAVLSVDEIGVNDNFFALGGHSLLAMQVMSRTREKFGVALTLRTIFDFPTVGAFAAELDAAAPAEPADDAPALVKIDRTIVHQRM
jgi:acyl carrier protein